MVGGDENENESTDQSQNTFPSSPQGVFEDDPPLERTVNLSPLASSRRKRGGLSTLESSICLCGLRNCCARAGSSMESSCGETESTVVRWRTKYNRRTKTRFRMKLAMGACRESEMDGIGTERVLVGLTSAWWGA
jgi:hypothetical protein